MNKDGKIYPSTALALASLGRRFGYEVVYFGDTDLLMVDTKGYKDESLHLTTEPKLVDKLLKLCRLYRSSDAGWRRDKRYVDGDFCEDDKVEGIGREEFMEHYCEG